MHCVVTIQDEQTLFIHYTYTDYMLIYEICKQSKTDGPFGFIMRKMMQIMWSQGIKAYGELNILFRRLIFTLRIQKYFVK